MEQADQNGTPAKAFVGGETPANSRNVVIEIRAVDRPINIKIKPGTRAAISIFLTLSLIISTLGIFWSYLGAPQAWVLQFEYPFGNDETIKCGRFVEILFSVILVFSVYFLLTQPFASYSERMLQALRGRVRWTSELRYAILLGVLILVIVVAKLWAYHSTEAPVALKKWAESVVDATPSVFSARELGKLREELAMPDVDEQYADAYRKYFLYSFGNFVMIAVLGFTVVAYSALSHFLLMSKLQSRLMKSKNIKTTERAETILALLELVPEIISNTLRSMALFFAITFYVCIANNLAIAARQWAVVGIIVVLGFQLTIFWVAILFYDSHYKKWSSLSATTNQRAVVEPKETTKLLATIARDQKIVTTCALLFIFLLAYLFLSIS